MTRTRFAALLFLVASQAAGVLQAQDPGSSRDEIVAEIARLDSVWLNAYVSGDANAVRPILADEFVGQLGDVVVDKGQLLNRVAAAPWTSTTLERLIVNVVDDLAIAHGVRQSVADAESGPVTSRFAYTDVYVFRGERWVCVTGQSATLEPLPQP